MSFARSAEQVRHDVCGAKIRYPGPGPARRAAADLNKRWPTAKFGHYRCPFPSEDRHWHAGHVPSLVSLEAIARVIRGLDPAPPTPHDPPERARRRRAKEAR